MIAFLPFHIIGMNNHLSNHLLHSIVQPIFFLEVYAHTAISFTKAFITLGIGNAKFIKILDIVMKVFCLFLFIISLVGLYFVMYGRWLG